MSSINDFYTIKKCHRCQSLFTESNRRIQSWFTDEVICSTKCNLAEKSILELLGEKAEIYEDCGFLPNLTKNQKKEFTNLPHLTCPH